MNVLRNRKWIEYDRNGKLIFERIFFKGKRWKGEEYDYYDKIDLKHEDEY